MEYQRKIQQSKYLKKIVSPKKFGASFLKRKNCGAQTLFIKISRPIKFMKKFMECEEFVPIISCYKLLTFGGRKLKTEKYLKRNI